MLGGNHSRYPRSVLLALFIRVDQIWLNLTCAELLTAGVFFVRQHVSRRLDGRRQEFRER